MIGPRFSLSRNARDEAEKPFWISYADLMTSLAVLFLILMLTLLVAVAVQKKDEVSPQRIEDLEQTEAAYNALKSKNDALEERRAEFEKELRDALEPLGVTVAAGRILFGDITKFENGSAEIPLPDQAKIRKAVARIIEVYQRRDPGGTKLRLQNIDVEGFASPRGGYFFNLNLSLQRAQSVMCSLLTGPTVVPDALGKKQQDFVARVFAIGGRSSNDVKQNDTASRRVELSLRYLDQGEVRPPRSDVRWDKIFDYNTPGTCPVTQ